MQVKLVVKLVMLLNVVHKEESAPSEISLMRCQADVYICLLLKVEIFGDPHFIVPPLLKEVLCYSIQGYPGLAFNLIYNKNFIINAQFVDSIGDTTEATWIGKLAVIPQNATSSNAVIFDSVNP